MVGAQITIKGMVAAVEANSDNLYILTLKSTEVLPCCGFRINIALQLAEKPVRRLSDEFFHVNGRI